MAAYTPLYGVSLDADDHERLAVIALLRSATRRDRVTKAEVVELIVREWLAGPGQAELASAADRLAGPRIQSAG